MAKVTHGMSQTPEYRAWASMRTRCNNPKAKMFRLYGGRGIKICDRWNDFEVFYADMGNRPSSLHSLDRHPNPNGNYEPTNCRWANPIEQSNNLSTNVRIAACGQNLTLRQWSERTGLRPGTIYNRLRAGWSGPEAVGAVAGKPPAVKFLETLRRRFSIEELRERSRKANAAKLVMHA